MSDELYQAFRIYFNEGLLGKDEEQLLETIKDYNPEKRNEVIDAYMRVTKDPILKTMIPELQYYDLNNVSIKELYAERKRTQAIETTNNGNISPQKEETKETTNFIEDAKTLQNKIAKQMEFSDKNMAIEELPPQDIESKPFSNISANQNKKRLDKSMKLTQVGYANVVLMSIIVIIIVAIICVFIFA